MKPIDIEILGKKYHLRSDNPEKIRQYARYINEHLEELYHKFNTVDQHKLFVLYLLQLTEKYFDEKEQNEKLSKQSEDFKALLDKIEI
ncbi:MAG: cell division protein ZapA [Candidatus Cloacimonadota bacterium]|nr:cell division protein ZapA [Candidatus Cloacimonadota bacterium]